MTKERFKKTSTDRRIRELFSKGFEKKARCKTVRDHHVLYYRESGCLTKQVSSTIKSLFNTSVGRGLSVSGLYLNLLQTYGDWYKHDGNMKDFCQYFGWGITEENQRKADREWDKLINFGVSLGYTMKQVRDFFDNQNERGGWGKNWEYAYCEKGYPKKGFTKEQRTEILNMIEKGLMECYHSNKKKGQ